MRACMHVARLHQTGRINLFPQYQQELRQHLVRVCCLRDRWEHRFLRRSLCPERAFNMHACMGVWINAVKHEYLKLFNACMYFNIYVSIYIYICICWAMLEVYHWTRFCTIGISELSGTAIFSISTSSLSRIEPVLSWTNSNQLHACMLPSEPAERMHESRSWWLQWCVRRSIIFFMRDLCPRRMRYPCMKSVLVMACRSLCHSRASFMSLFHDVLHINIHKLTARNGMFDDLVVVFGPFPCIFDHLLAQE